MRGDSKLKSRPAICARPSGHAQIQKLSRFCLCGFRVRDSAHSRGGFGRLSAVVPHALARPGDEQRMKSRTGW